MNWLRPSAAAVTRTPDPPDPPDPPRPPGELSSVDSRCRRHKPPAHVQRCLQRLLGSEGLFVMLMDIYKKMLAEITKLCVCVRIFLIS